jgi:hypothetical protein
MSFAANLKRAMDERNLTRTSRNKKRAPRYSQYLRAK